MSRQKVTAAIGTFDGVHLGHQYVLKELVAQARIRGNEAAAVTFDAHPLQTIAPEIAPKQLCDEKRRDALLRDYGAERVITLSFNRQLRSLSARQFMESLKKDHGIDSLVLGYDNSFGCENSHDLAFYCLQGQLAGVEVIPLQSYQPLRGKHISSSTIRLAISQGDIPAATEMLGHYFITDGTVRHGRKLGRSIGFPTANILPDCPLAQLPMAGVYATRLAVDGQTYPSVTNLGNKPTVGDGLPLSIETHVPGHSLDLYGRHVQLIWCCRLRSEQRFGSFDQLADQLHRDVDMALRYFSTH